MRRLWSYILLACTTLALMIVTFPSLMNKIDTNADYKSGYEMYFRIAEKDDGEELNEDGLLSIADEFSNRLEKSNITAYEVKVVGDDTISVLFAANSSEDYANMRTYLSCDGSFALASPVPGNYVEADELLSSSKAYIDTYNNYPCIILPINVDSTEYKTTYESIKNAKDENKSEYAESSTSGEGEEQQTTYTYYLYLFYNWNAEAFDTGSWKDNVNNDDSSAFNRFCMKFRIEDDAEQQYFPDGDNNKLYSMINLDLNSDGQASVKEKSTAYSRANFFVNILNASEYDYKVTYMYQELIVGGRVENLFDYSANKTISYSLTFVAALVTVVLTAAFLFAIYHLPGLSTALVSLGSIYAAIFAMTLLNAEYHVMAILGLIAVGLASIASGVIYSEKLKAEAYRGRSLKKANLEAGKKSLLPIVDINVSLIVIGVFAYLLGGTFMRSFAVTTVLGGLASLVLNIFALKGLNWLLANNTSFQKKYGLFGVKEDRVPNTLKEEKQTYFGPLNGRNLAKHFSKLTIASVALALISLVGIVTFSATKGSILNTSYPQESSLIYFETHTDLSDPSEFVSPLMKEDSVRYILDHTYVYTTDEAKSTQLSSYIEEIKTPDSYIVVDADKNTTTYFQYVVALKDELSEDLNAYYIDESTGDKISTEDNKINTVLAAGLDNENFDTNGTVSLKEKAVHAMAKLNIRGVALASIIAGAVLSVYFMLRYRSFSRGLVTFILNVFVQTIIIGVFTFSRLNIPSIAFGAVLIVSLIGYIVSIYALNREREMKLDVRGRENSDEAQDITVKATDSSAVTSGLFLTFAALITFTFFGIARSYFFPVYLSIFFGTILVLLFITISVIPNSELFSKAFKFKGIKKPTRKKKKNKQIKTNKSAEPEEAIFIGIND